MNRTQINTAKVGRYGRKLLAYMKEYNQDLYTELLFASKLESWLAEQNEICKERIWEYTVQITKAQGIKEELKVHDQMAWVGAMNAIRAQAEGLISTKSFIRKNMGGSAGVRTMLNVHKRDKFDLCACVFMGARTRITALPARGGREYRRRITSDSSHRLASPL